MPWLPLHGSQVLPIAGPEGYGGGGGGKDVCLTNEGRSEESHHHQVPAGLCIYMQSSLGCSYVLDSALSHFHTWLKVVVERVLERIIGPLLTLGSAGVLLRPVFLSVNLRLFWQ